MTTWAQVAEMIAATSARNIRVANDRRGSPALWGNDGTILTFDPKIAAGYVQTDWDAINCQQTR